MSSQKFAAVVCAVIKSVAVVSALVHSFEMQNIIQYWRNLDAHETLSVEPARIEPNESLVIFIGEFLITAIWENGERGLRERCCFRKTSLTRSFPERIQSAHQVCLIPNAQSRQENIFENEFLPS